MATSANFSVLTRYDTALLTVAARVELYFSTDPVRCLMKFRQFGKLLAQQVAARMAIYTTAEESQSDLLARFRVDNTNPREALDLFHTRRRIVERILRALKPAGRAGIAVPDDMLFAATTRALLDRLEHSILARAFRGDLVPLDPSDEPAVTASAHQATRAGRPARRHVATRACPQLSQMTAAARWTAPRKFLAVLSYRVAMALNCLSLAKKFSIRCRAL